MFPHPSESICSLDCHCVILICSTFSTHVGSVRLPGGKPAVRGGEEYISGNMSANGTNDRSQPIPDGSECSSSKRLNTRWILLCVSGAVWFLTQTCSVDGVCGPRSPQLECQSVPVEQSSRQTQPRECTAQAQSQEIALENTPVWRLIIREGGGKYGAL